MQLRIVTWNIFYGKELHKILESIKTNKDFANIDFFAIQEASVHEGIEDTQRIAQTLGKEYDYFQVTAQESKGLAQANAIIWNTKRVIVTNKEVLHLPNFTQVRLGNLEKTFKYLSKKEKRNSIIIEGTIEKKTFRIYAAHFDVIGFRLKTEQLRCVLEDDEKRNTVDFICIAGDLNTFKIIKRPTWGVLKLLAQDHGFIDITSQINWTFHKKAIRFYQKTDSIFIKNNNPVSYFSMSSNIPGSDHIPIFANIEM